MRRKRTAEGLSIRALAGTIGVSFSSLARIERGEGDPDNNSKIRIIEWLGSYADDVGIAFDKVAFVHFRAMKNVKSSTVQALLRAAEKIRNDLAPDAGQVVNSNNTADHDVVALTKDELESIAIKFRKEIGLQDEDLLDPLHLAIEGIRVLRHSQCDYLDIQTSRRLCGDSCAEWSAMSVPLASDHEKWAVLLNDCHVIERQRVTLLEEYWHILLGHKLTKVARIADSYGRTYDKTEEHDAYFLAAATLLPKKSIERAVITSQPTTQIAKRFGTSAELVDYRIKRLGLWRERVGKKIILGTSSN